MCVFAMKRIGAGLIFRIAASSLSETCAYCASTMKMPSEPASTPTRPPAASGWFTSTFGEPLIMYRFCAICFVVNSILLKSVPCAHTLTDRAAAADAASVNCHAGFMTRSLLEGSALPIVMETADPYKIRTASPRELLDLDGELKG